MNAKTRLCHNPWIDGLDELMDPEVVWRRLFRRPESLSARVERTGESRAEALEPLLKEICVPNERACKILVRLIDRLRSSLACRYPDPKTYLRRMYQEDQDPDELAPVICLTGPSGVGKSHLISSFMRLVATSGHVRFSAEHPEVLIERVRRINIGARSTDGMIFTALSNPDFVGERESYSRDAALKHIPQWLYNCGVGLLLVDEMQFLTQSSKANTRVTQVLMSLGHLGPPMVFVSNYSLGHRLRKRNDEEHQRLLGEPIVYEPESSKSEFWRTLIAEYVRVAPEILALCPERDAWRLWVLTGGLPRLLRRLIVTAVREEADAHTGAVAMAEVEQAYFSVAFSSHRETVEAMHSLALSPTLSKSRTDLVCPFPEHSNYGALVREAQGHLTRPSPWDTSTGSSMVPPPAAQHMLESTLSPQARKAYKELRAGGEAVSRREKEKATVRPLRRGSGVTEAGLYAGAQAMRDLGARSGKPTRPLTSDEDEQS